MRMINRTINTGLLAFFRDSMAVSMGEMRYVKHVDLKLLAKAGSGRSYRIYSVCI